MQPAPSTPEAPSPSSTPPEIAAYDFERPRDFMEEAITRFGIRYAEVTRIVSQKTRIKQGTILPHLKAEHEAVQERGRNTRRRIEKALADLWQALQENPFDVIPQVACDMSPLKELAGQSQLPISGIARYLDLSASQREALYKGVPTRVDREMWSKHQELMAILQDPEQAKNLELPKAPSKKQPPEDPYKITPIRKLVTEIQALNPSIGTIILADFIGLKIKASQTNVFKYFKQRSIPLEESDRHKQKRVQIETALQDTLQKLSENPYLVNGFVTLGTALLRAILKQKNVPATVAGAEIGLTHTQIAAHLGKGVPTSATKAQVEAYMTFVRRVRNDEEYCKRLRKRAQGGSRPKETHGWDDEDSQILDINPDCVRSTAEFPYGWSHGHHENGAGGRWNNHHRDRIEDFYDFAG